MLYEVITELNAAQQQYLSDLGEVSAVVEMRAMAHAGKNDNRTLVELRITSYNVCYTKLLRISALGGWS